MLALDVKSLKQKLRPKSKIATNGKGLKKSFVHATTICVNTIFLALQMRGQTQVKCSVKHNKVSASVSAATWHGHQSQLCKSLTLCLDFSVLDRMKKYIMNQAVSIMPSL